MIVGSCAPAPVLTREAEDDPAEPVADTGVRARSFALSAKTLSIRADAYGPDAPAGSQEPLPPTAIPFGFTTFPGEIWRTPRSWVDASYPNVIYFNEVDRGGHFAAWEEPELFAAELRKAFSSLR